MTSAAGPSHSRRPQNPSSAQDHHDAMKPQQNSGAAKDRAADVVVFDLGGVLVDWNPRYLYRQLFGADSESMEHFLTEV